MEISDFPPEELEVLEQLGSRDPRAELIAFVLVAKASRHRRQRPSIRSELKAIPERMNQIGAARPRQAASKSNLGEMSEEQKRTFQEIMSLNKN